MRKTPKQAEAKRDGVINPQNYNFYQFLHGKLRCSQNATSQPKSTVELGYMCPRGLNVCIQMILTDILIKTRLRLHHCTHAKKNNRGAAHFAANGLHVGNGVGAAHGRPVGILLCKLA